MSQPSATPPTTTELAAKLADFGLRLPASDVAKLEPMAAELATSAAMIRKERSYLEEPIHTLKLWTK